MDNYLDIAHNSIQTTDIYFLLKLNFFDRLVYAMRCGPTGQDNCDGSGLAGIFLDVFVIDTRLDTRHRRAGSPPLRSAHSAVCGCCCPNSHSGWTSILLLLLFCYYYYNYCFFIHTGVL